MMCVEKLEKIIIYNYKKFILSNPRKSKILHTSLHKISWLLINELFVIMIIGPINPDEPIQRSKENIWFRLFIYFKGIQIYTPQGG